MTMKSYKKPAILLTTAVYFACLSLLVSLGIWQFMRGQYKAGLESKIRDSNYQTILVGQSPNNWASLNYAIVKLKGQIDYTKSLFLDNRIHEGQPGYEVFVPFIMQEDGSTLLINRGWVAKNKTVAVTELPLSMIPQEVSGQLYMPETGFTLGPAYIESSKWPKTIQYLDLAALSSLLNTPLEPVVLVLDEGDSRALERLWQPYAINATRHYGYAVQWWGLATVLIVFGFIWRNGQQSNSSHNLFNENQ